MASRFWVGGTGTWDAADTTHWSATSGGAGGVSVPGSGDDVTIDASSGAGTITVNTNFNIASLTCGAMGMTLDFSANNNSPTITGALTTSGTGTRTINWGSGTFTMSGNNITIFSNGTNSNQTMTGSATFNFTYSGSVGTRAFQFGGTGSGTIIATTCTFNITAGTDTVSFSGTNIGIPSLNFTGFSGTWTSSSTSISFGTNLTMSAAMTNSVTAILQWTITSSSGILTSNGKSFASAFIVNASSGTLTLADSFVTTSSLTLTLGTLDANGFNVTCQSFSSSNSNTRTLTMGSGTWTITGNNATIFTISTTTGLTITGNPTIVMNYAGSTGTRTINGGTSATLFVPGEIRVTGGTDIVALGANTFYNSFNFTGFSGTWPTAVGNNFVGNLTLSSGMTVTPSANTVNFVGTSGSQSLTSNGNILDRNINFNGIGGTFVLADNLNSNAKTVTLTNGTFNANGFNVTCGSVSSTGSNVRTLTMGTGTWTLTGTAIVLNLGTSTNLTLSSSSCTILVTDTSSSSKTFSLGVVTGGISYGTITVSPGGSGAVVFTAGATMTIAALNCAGPKTLNFTGARTYVITSMSINGTAGNLVTLASSTPGSQYSISVASGLVEARYVAIQDSIATGGAYFQAINSTDNGNNTGWNFVTAAAAGGLSVGKKFAAFGGARPINKALDSKLHGYRKLGG